MKKQDYVVCRNNIYVGHVARVNKYFINKVSDDEDNDDFSEILVNDYTIYRSILFTPNQENQAQDFYHGSGFSICQTAGVCPADGRNRQTDDDQQHCRLLSEPDSAGGFPDDRKRGSRPADCPRRLHSGT